MLPSSKPFLGTLFATIFVIPLAILVGFLLADPTDFTSMVGFGLLFLFFSIPFLIYLHHTVLILSCTAFINAFFLPGEPQMWMLLAGLSFLISIISRPLHGQTQTYCGNRSLDLSVVFMMAVVLFTMKATGGTGFNILGAQVFGGRRYITMLAAVVGYFALILNPLSLEKAKSLGSMFWLMSCSSILGNLAFALGPSFYFLFYLFPVDFVISQANADNITLSGGFVRLSGLAPLGFGLLYWLLARFGLAGILDWRKSWRLSVALLGLLFILMAGFRSNLILLMLLFIVLFFMEKLHRTIYAAILVGLLLLSSSFLIAFSDRMPLTIQRSLSFLPLKVETVAKADAEGSLNWRLDMWRVVVTDIPRYFWVGKGFSINPTDLYFSQIALRRGFYSPSEAARLAGDYHNGPLSVIIPFGILGVIGFVWFLTSVYCVLRNNYKYGHPELRKLNRFFLGFFIARVIFFVVFFGAATSDFWLFAALAGLNLSMNRGMARAPQPIQINPQSTLAGTDESPAVAGKIPVLV